MSSNSSGNGITKSGGIPTVSSSVAVPNNLMLKAVKSLHKQWSKQLKSKTPEEVNEVLKYCTDDAFMLLGGGMESLAKNILNRDTEIKKRLIHKLHNYLGLSFHEEANRGNEYAPSSIHTKRIIAFLHQSSTIGCTGHGASAITSNFESSDSSLVEFSLALYRILLAGILSLPVSNKLRNTFVDAQSMASANASGTSSEPSHCSAILAIIKYIEQSNHALSSPYPSTTASGTDTVTENAPATNATGPNITDPNTNTPSTVPKRKVGATNTLPDFASLPLLSTPSIIGTIEALRSIHLLLNECFNPSRSVNARPTYEEVIQNGFTNVTASTNNKSSSTSNNASASSSSNVSRSLSPRRGSSNNTTNTGSALRSSLINLIPRLLPSLLSLAQVRSVEIDDEPNAKTGTQAIRSLASLCIADCTWILVTTSPSLPGSNVAVTKSASTSNSTTSTTSSPNYEMNARVAIIQSMSTIITILSRSLHDQTIRVQGAIVRFTLEQTGMVTPNGEVPPPVPATLVPSVTVTESPPTATKAAEKPPTGKGAPTDKKGKDTKTESVPAPAPAPVPVPAPAPPPPIGAEYGLEAGQYESTCKYLMDSTPAGDENQCWSYVNPIDVGATKKETVPKVRIIDNDTPHGTANDHHEASSTNDNKEKKYDTFSFAIASIEHGYTVISHILCGLLRCSVAVPFVSGTSVSIVDNDHEDEHESNDTNTPNEGKRVPTWKLVSTCAVSLLAIPETSHKREITKLLSLLLARMAACADSLRTTACAAGVLPVLTARLRDNDTDTRTRDVVEGVIHVLLSPVSTVLPSPGTTTVGPATTAIPLTNTHKSVSSMHSSMISGSHPNGTMTESKHDDESKHETNDDDGIAVLHGNPHHPACLPLNQTTPHMVSTEYLTEITGPEAPTTFVRRLVDPRVLVFDSVNANAAGITMDTNSVHMSASSTPVDPKTNPKATKVAPSTKNSTTSASSSEVTDKAVLLPEPSLPAGITRATVSNTPSATYGPWLGTIDIALLLCSGYMNQRGNGNDQPSNGTTTNTVTTNTVPTPINSRPPSRSAVDSSSGSSNSSSPSTSSAIVELAPVTPPSTVFDHTCPDLSLNWPVWNLPIDEIVPIIPWVPVTVGSGTLHTEESTETEHHHHEHGHPTETHHAGSITPGTKPGTIVTKQDTAKGTTPSSSVAPTKKGGSGSSVAPSESATRHHGNGIHDLPKLSMVSIVKSFNLLIPSLQHDEVPSVVAGAVVWDSRLRGLRLAASFLRLAEENQSVRDILLASKVPAMVARIMVDAITCAYRIPFMVGAVAGSMYTPPASSSSSTDTSLTTLHTGTESITSSVTNNDNNSSNQTTINYYTSITVDNDILLQSLLITLHMLFTLLRLPGNASADICITLSELGPIVPDSILAAALHTDILKLLPSLEEVFTSNTTKLNMNHFNRTESFLIPVCLTDPRSILQAFDKLPGTVSTYTLTTEVGEIRSWALYTLRAFAAADREHRTYDWSSPIVPIPGQNAIHHDHEGTADAGKKGGAANKAAPPKDAGKKPTDKGKGAPVPTDAAPVAVNTVFKAPSHPAAGSPVVGVDWNCKTESIGERLALSVVRYVPLLMASLSHNSTAGGLLYPILSGPLMTHNLAVQPLTGSAVRIGILHLIDEAFTVYRARDRLTVEIMNILREYSLVAATLRKREIEESDKDTSHTSAYTMAALTAAQRLFTTPRNNDNGLPILYGRLGTLVLGYSMGFNGQLHSLSSVSHGPALSANVSSAPVTSSAPVNDKKAPAKPAVVDKKGGKAVATAESTTVSTESFAAILTVRRHWKHPIENWGCLPPPVSSQIEDILHNLHNPSTPGHTENSSTENHSSPVAVPVYHDFDRFCTYGKPYYVGIEVPTTEETTATAVAAENRPPTSTSTAKPDPKKPHPTPSKGPEHHAIEHDSETKPVVSSGSSSVHLPDIFTLPLYVWPVATNVQETVQNIFKNSPSLTENSPTTSDKLYATVPATAIEIHRLYASSTGILTSLLQQLAPNHIEAISSHGTLAVQDSVRAILASTILSGFVKPITKFTAYRDPLPSEPEILLGFRILSRCITDTYRGLATQTSTTELAVAEAIRAGLILHTLALTDIPPVPVESHEFSHSVINNFIYGVRPIRTLPNEKLWLWKNSLILSPTGRQVLSMEARTLLMYLRNRPATRLQHWGRVPNVHTRPLSTDELSALPSLGDHPDWSLLPEGIHQVDVGNHTVTEEVYLGRDDPLYPVILDGYVASLTHPPTDSHATEHPSTDAHAHPHDTTELTLTLPLLKRNVLAFRKTYFSTYIFGPVLDLASPVGRLGNQVLSPLFAALVLDADENFISSLINNGAFVDVRRTGDNVTPLMLALAGGKLSIATALLGHGADPNAKDGSGNPVIKYAFVTTNENGKKDIQALEADRTAAAVELPVDTVYSRLLTTLERTHHHPTGPGHRTVSAATTSSTPSLGSIKQMFGASAAILQRMARRMILRRRLDAARRSLRDSHSLKNHIPVVFADRQMVIDAMRLLIDCGADVVTAKDAGGNTVLHWLVAGAFLMYPALHTKSCRYVPVYHAPPSLGLDTRQLMDLFLAFGARINAQNNRGATPLHCALECGKMAVSVHLVKLGADTALADKIGCLPMHYAALGRGFHDTHPGLTNVYESELTSLSGELNAAEAALFDKQEINEHLPQARIVSPRAEFFLDMVLRALQHGREVDGKQVIHQQNSSSISSLESSRNAPVRPKVRTRRNPSSRSTHDTSTYSSKEMDGDDYEFTDSKENTSEHDHGNNDSNDNHILRPLTPSDILLHTNRYGITPLHVAAGANIDGTLSLTLRQGSTAYSMPTTFTGVHPMLLTLARHGSSVRAAAITVNGVNFNGSVDNASSSDTEVPNSETFIMVAINREYTAEFLFGCADETTARADIMYTALGLPDVLSGARAILAEVRAMQADNHLQQLLTDCMNLFENRRGLVAATKVISREDVIDATKGTLDISHTHAEALVTARCKSGRNALHYAMLSWHSPLQELIGAGGKYLLGKETTVVSSTMNKTRNGIAAGLRAHYAACWRIARYLVAAARGTLATPVMREPMTIEAWRRSRPRHVNTLAYIPSREEDKGGHTDADTVPYPGVALIQRREIIADPSSALLVEDRPPVGRVRALQRTQAKQHGVANVVVVSSTVKETNDIRTLPPMNEITPQGSQLSENSILSAGSGQIDARNKDTILTNGSSSGSTTENNGLRGFSPVGYSLIHLRMLSLYSTALVGLDCNDLGIAIPKESSTGSSNSSIVCDTMDTSSPNDGFTRSTFVPPNLGIRGIIESPTWAIIALGLFNNNDPTSMDHNSIDYYYNSMNENPQQQQQRSHLESKEKEATEIEYLTASPVTTINHSTNSITMNRERAKRGNPVGVSAASGALDTLKGTIDPSPSLMKVLQTTAGRK